MDNSHEEFLKAMGAYVPPPTIEYEYRIYYNPDTMRVTSKSVEDLPGTFIIVSKEEYYNVFVPGPYKVKNGKVIKLQLDTVPDNMLSLNNEGEYRTIKDNNMFLVDDSYTGPIDIWKRND